jgi:hypothetical protein
VCCQGASPVLVCSLFRIPEHHPPHPFACPSSPLRLHLYPPTPLLLLTMSAAVVSTTRLPSQRAAANSCRERVTSLAAVLKDSSTPTLRRVDANGTFWKLMGCTTDRRWDRWEGGCMGYWGTPNYPATHHRGPHNQTTQLSLITTRAVHPGLLLQHTTMNHILLCSHAKY